MFTAKTSLFTGSQNDVSVPAYKSIRFVGDVMLARNVETLMNTYGSDYPYSQLPAQGTSSLLVGNFEGAIRQEHVQTPDFTYAFSVDKKHLDALYAYGFTHLGLANNHSFDFGLEDFEHTYAVLQNSSTTPFGHPNIFATSSAVYATIDSSTVGIIALQAVDSMPSDDAITEVLEYVAAQSDVQIVYVHWGIEYESQHSIFQGKLAHSLVDAGADIIIGHHPHVVQDIEKYNESIIFYSLGNFIFDQYFDTAVQEGLMLDISFQEEKPLITLLPVTSIGSKSAPYSMGIHEKTLFLTDVAQRSDKELSEMILSGTILMQ